MATMEGHITVAQESRFQLTDRGGVSHQFVLSPSAAAEPQQLAPLAAAQARVRVTFSQAEGAISFLARRIELLGAEAGR